METFTKSLTSNAAERWNRKIKKILSSKYGLKSPETIMQLINCLWFKELITNGRIHLDQNSIIYNIIIGKICQENEGIEFLKQFFEIKAFLKAS